MESIVSPRSFFALILALASGGTAAIGVNSYVRNRASTGTNQELVKVALASADIPRGTLVKANQVKFQDIPKHLVHPRAITKLDDAVNRAVITPMLKDEPLLDGKLAPKGSRGSMASVTKPGMRAFTIQTPSLAAGVAGFVMPGDHVDVLLTMTGDSNGGSTSTLLQNVEVLAVDQRIEAPAENKLDLNQLRSVTLHVTPEQSLLLNLAQSKGMLHLSLRNPDDIQDSKTRPAILADLPSRLISPAKVFETAPAPVVEVIPPEKVAEVIPPKPVESRNYVYVYRTSLQRVEKHRTDGTPASLEPSETIVDSPRGVEVRYTSSLPGRLDGNEGQAERPAAPEVAESPRSARPIDIKTIQGFRGGAISLGRADQADDGH